MGKAIDRAQWGRLTLALPDWLMDVWAETPAATRSETDRMGVALRFAREAVERKAGGPFGAAVFSSDGELIAPGINLVVASGCSLWHAEMVAIALAQQRLGRYDLSRGGQNPVELVATSEPCAMCYGAIPWAGISRLLCGARADDARSVGFDEGAKPAQWMQELRRRGIEVKPDVGRREAQDLLQSYHRKGGVIYSPGSAVAPTDPP